MEAQAHALVCSCGEAAAHVVARRTTVDGIIVCLWSDGAVTGALGARLRGVPVARPKTPEAVRVALRGGWAFMDWVSLHDTDELGELYCECRAAAKAGMDLAAWRKARAERCSLSPVWEVYETDRAGRPTLRLWNLPRILFGGGLAVWDHCSSGGRYELVNVERVHRGRVVDLVCGNGIRFANLVELERHLVAERGHG